MAGVDHDTLAGWLTRLQLTAIRDELARLDRKRPKKGSNDDWTHPQDPDAKITKMKDGSDEPGPHRPDQRRYLLTAPSRVLILAA